MAKQIRGLATVALLKANFDQGNDYLDQWQTFLMMTSLSWTCRSAFALLMGFPSRKAFCGFCSIE